MLIYEAHFSAVGFSAQAQRDFSADGSENLSHVKILSVQRGVCVFVCVCVCVCACVCVSRKEREKNTKCDVELKG